MNRRSCGVSLMDAMVFVAIVGMIGAAVFAVSRMDKRGKRGGKSVADYEAKARALEQIPERLFTYAEDDGCRKKLDFKAPRGLAVDADDRIYIAGDKKVAIYSKAGALERQFAVDAPPRSLTVTKDGKIFVTFKQHVAVYTPTGTRTARWKALGPKSYLTSIAVSAKEVFVADFGRRLIHVFDHQGTLQRRIGEAEPGKAGHFNIPSPYFDLLVGLEQTLYVVNPGVHTIETYGGENLGERLDHKWGRYGADIEGFCGCCNPVNIAQLPGGGFVTAEKGLTRIKELDPNGRLLGVVAGPKHFKKHDKKVCAIHDPSGCAEGGLDLAVDSRGRVVVLDPYTAELRIFVKKKS